MMIKISVIVTTYNRPEYLSETLDAIFSQTYRNFEVILIDDGSRENYVDIYKEKYPELILIKKKNAGLSAARNTGVEHSTGEWIAFCDDDDVWVVDKLERQVEAIDVDPNVGLIHGRIEYIDKNGKRQKPKSYVDTSYYKRRGNSFLKAIEMVLVKSPTPLIKRAVFDQAGGFNEKIKVGEDCEFYMKMAFYTRFLYLDETLAKYRLHDLGQLSQKSEQYLLISAFQLNFVKAKKRQMSLNTYLSALKSVVRVHLTELHNNKRKFNVKTFFHLLKITPFFIFDIKALRIIKKMIKA